MPAEMKRQQLLGKEDPRKKRKPKQKPKPSQQQVAQQIQAQAQANAKAQAKAAQKGSSLGKKIKMTLLAILAIAIIIVPKPQLLQYKKLGLTATSIYIPGWFGQPGKLLDSPQRVVLDKERGLVYLCFGKIDPEKQLKEQCNRFQFVSQQGMFAAFSHYRSNPTP